MASISGAGCLPWKKSSNAAYKPELPTSQNDKGDQMIAPCRAWRRSCNARWFASSFASRRHTLPQIIEEVQQKDHVVPCLISSRNFDRDERGDAFTVRRRIKIWQVA